MNNSTFIIMLCMVLFLIYIVMTPAKAQTIDFGPIINGEPTIIITIGDTTFIETD